MRARVSWLSCVGSDLRLSLNTQKNLKTGCTLNFAISGGQVCFTSSRAKVKAVDLWYDQLTDFCKPCKRKFVIHPHTHKNHSSNSHNAVFGSPLRHMRTLKATIDLLSKYRSCFRKKAL